MITSPTTQIRPGREADADALASIYNHYVLNTIVSFEEEPISGGSVLARLSDVRSASLPWLVLETASQVAGFAYASPWKSRRGYRCSVESSIYLSPAHLGNGLGTRLYSALLDELRLSQLHVVIAGIALPNPASIRLHEKLGFRQVAHFTEVGLKFGRWIDVANWQLILTS